MTFNHATAAQFRQRLRAKYKTATQVEALKIGAWIAGNLTLGQIQSLFSVTNPQAQAIQARCQTMATQLASMRAAAGE